MKRILLNASSAVLLFALLLPGSALAEIKTVTLSVPTMNCSLCPLAVRSILRRVPGVANASADLGSKTATVKFDTDKTDVQALIDATTSAGYPSTLKQ
ncbi:MAG: mercury resistance system periplasmic binding protein MerP [Gammaproteobacteria bacterium]|nr:MAG: mercury resistance system periplasmic binding protein MerP [Gammaproteobacteria bacterium]